MSSSGKYELTFFTNELYKDIIIDSLRFMVQNNRINLHAFVIMNSHLHLVWNIIPPNEANEMQRDFLRFTAKATIKDLKNNNTDLLTDFYVNAKDRKCQVWERHPLSVDIWTEEVLKQKLDYVHNNPVKAGYCSYAKEYKYSTAALYQSMPCEWDYVVQRFL